MTNDPLILTAMMTALGMLPFLAGWASRTMFPAAWLTLTFAAYATAAVVLVACGII